MSGRAGAGDTGFRVAACPARAAGSGSRRERRDGATRCSYTFSCVFLVCAGGGWGRGVSEHSLNATVSLELPRK